MIDKEKKQATEKSIPIPPPDQKIKKISCKFLLDSGLLFEINRVILHPYGLALEMLLSNDGEDAVLGDLWDYRDDPVGMLFEAKTFEEGKKKYNKFETEFGVTRLLQRELALGFIVQTGPPPPLRKDGDPDASGI